MLTLIGESYEDTKILLDRLAGEHRMSRPAAIASVVGGILMAGVLAGLAFTNRSQSHTPADFLTLLILVCLAVAVVLGLTMSAFSVSTFTPDGVSRRGLFGSGTVAAGEISKIFLALDRGQALIFHTMDGRKLSIPIVTSMQAPLARIYPGMFGPVVLPRSVGRVAYAVLALVVIAFIVLVAITVSRGLVSWK